MDQLKRLTSDCQRYLGRIGVKQSMKMLDNSSRSEVAKESIERLSSTDNDIQVKSINRLLEDTPNLAFRGTKVKLIVTETHLSIMCSQTEEIIIRHELPNISFGSDGDTDDYVAYVARDEKIGRACFVFQCLNGNAKDVLRILASAFELRKQLQLRLNNHFRRIGTESNNLQPDEDVITATRRSLEKESWYHGSYLSREDSETRLKNDGDFLVREKMLVPGQFVLSIMHKGDKLHLLFDSIEQVRTKEMEFEDINDLVKYHYDQETPIIAEDRVIYLKHGVKPPQSRPT